MNEIQLAVQLRNEIGSQKIRAVRREDCVPAIVYGGAHQPTAIKVNRREFERIRRAYHGELVFHLNVFEGDKKLRDYSAIVKEEQHDPVSDSILHIDFKRISLKEKIEVKVQIVAKGEPVGVKRDGGSLEHVLWELDVVCLPTAIPQEFILDVSALEIGDTLHVKDIVLPEGVVTNHDEEAIVFTVAPPMKEEEAQPAAEGEELTEPEVTKEKKEGEEEKSKETKAEEPKKDEEKKEG